MMRCPKCKGPAVLLIQNGEISCARQCNQTSAERAKRFALEGVVAKQARELRARLPQGVGFALVLFDFGETGSMAYASNGERSGLKAMLRELADKLETENN